MKKWTIPCIDNKTGKVIILTEAFYNTACAWLEHHSGKPLKVYEKGGMTVFEYQWVKYYHDEERDMLLKD